MTTATKTQVEESLDDIMRDNYALSVELGYVRGTPEVRPQPPHVSDETWDSVVWCYIDGLIQKQFFDTLEGRCSLSDFITFDCQKQEEYLLNHRSCLVAAIKPMPRGTFPDSAHFNEIYTRLIK